MKLLLLLMMIVHVGSSSGNEEKDHNKDAHRALCHLLSQAAGKWGEGGTGLSDPLRAALGKTIFGSESNEKDLGKFRENLPNVYQEADESILSRVFLCGQPFLVDMREKQPRLSGHSAPHDLLCLCTPGGYGWPLNNVEDKKLCGEDKNAWGGGKKGWTSSGHGKEQMKETWTKVVAKCLKDGGKGENLKYALEAFVKTLGTLVKGNKSYQDLGKGDFSSEYACSGIEETGICVKYYPEDQHAIPWWKQLQDVLKKEEQKEQKEREEAEKRKQEAQKQRQPHKQDQSLPQHEARTAALRSPPQDSQENEQSNPENFSSPLATLEDTSSTFIIPPCAWFPGAFLML